MKLAHVLPILTLVVPIACGKYSEPPWEAKVPTAEEKKAREAWLDTQRDITAACEDLILETTRPRAQHQEQLNNRVVVVQEVTEEASNRLLTFEGPMVVEKCKKALGALDAPKLACSNALIKPEKSNLGKKLRWLRFLFTVYDYNFSKRCVKDTRIAAPPLPMVDDIRWYLMNTANAYSDIDEYCKSKGLNSSEIAD
uniref:Uncharacterized protein n=1 Tax=Fusarium oxysporum (strain Fo5176) TaxID=660025 RepID=A0A0D2XP24_FUSOF